MIKWNMVLLLIICFCLPSNAAQITGATFSHDPATIVKEGDTYWHFFTAPGVGVATSKDLSNWQSSGKHVFTPGGNWRSNYPQWTIPYFGTTNNDGNLWAPDIIYMNGAYYLYYSCSSFGSSSSAIGLVKTTSLNNPSWKDMGEVVASHSGADINAIDPGLFRDDDGKVYMVYGSWHGGIGIVDIDTVTGSATSSATKLYGGNGLDVEAPALFKNGSYYYLVINRGDCCKGLNSTYKVLVGRSEMVKGPYKDYKTLLPVKDGRYIGPGHFSLLEDSCGDYVSIHYYDKDRNGTATLDILKLTMEDEWPVLTREFSFDECDTATATSFRNGTEQKSETSLQEDFTGRYRVTDKSVVITVSERHSDVNVSMYSINGSRYFTKKYNDVKTISIPNAFKKGMYIIKLTGKNHTCVRKVGIY